MKEMDRLNGGCALLWAGCLALGACAQAGADVNTVLNAQLARMKTAMPANAARVRAALGEAGKTAAVTYFAVPAMSDVMRLADAYPADGRLGGEVRAILSRGEFESASFELFSFEDRENVELKVSPLVCGTSKLEADLRVVKVWLQNGNAWVSYFDDAGLKLVPELLLHDENLIEVDLAKGANYARVLKDGKPTKVWISAPKELEAGAFDPYDPGFRDAEMLQPVRLERNAFKQFFLTFHAAKDQQPGVYRGSVAVTSQGRKLAEIPVAARVLPFDLPLPRCYRNEERPFYYSCMGAMPDKELLVIKCGNDRARGERAFRNWMQSLYDHSVFHAPSIEAKRGNQDVIPLLREIGFPLDMVWGDSMAPWFGLNFGGRLSFSQLMEHKAAAKACRAYYDKWLPGCEIWCGHGDEQGPGFVTAHREMFPFYSELGIKLGCAGHEALMYKGGYAYGYYPMGGLPDALEKARPWHEINDKPVGFYASQHTGSENPQFARMQHGLLSYLSGLSFAFNYFFATDGWNDRADELYKPMVIAYANGDGLMETIQYAGFREGCDDIRYATLVKGLCRQAREKGSTRAKVTAEKALHFLALLDHDKMDLNAVRSELIEYALKIEDELSVEIGVFCHEIL